jgi:predicted Rossmann fold flavoprotein
VIVLGAGAAGMMCAIEAGKRGRSVLVVDHAAAPGEKIRISGGGRCNFTNLHTAPDRFLSDNPRFCISALRRYTARDFIALVDRHGIAHHEKTMGQLFCDGSAKQIVAMLVDEMTRAGAELRLGLQVGPVARTAEGFSVAVGGQSAACTSLVVATGGKSIPKMGASGFGYDMATQFGLPLTEIRPALVPLTLQAQALEHLRPLAGVAVDATVGCGRTRFHEAILFTHRGLSGPAILQISSYWKAGGEISIAMAPGVDVFAMLRAARTSNPRQALHNALAALLPKRLAQLLAEQEGALRNLADLSDAVLRRIDTAVNGWRLTPAGSEGYRTAEVTLGGVDTRELDSRTMEARRAPGLY